MIRFIHIALIAVMMATSLGMTAQADMYKGYETPDYDVLESRGEVELRRYAPHLVAEVAVKGDREGAIGRGFKMLAGYIFGGNATGEKVAMTSPVSQRAETGQDGLWTVRFMMPARYSRETLPAPESAAIRFVETRIETHLVIRFSGRWTESALSDRERALRSEAAARGLRVEGTPIYRFYDGPFTLPWNRRNEIALVVN